mmetsp:Transcript_10173/g.18839  ORF Transcript_10173/g.18839 Transcript_10173/m.18839 type:complete len:244 (+) Transcript_10173:791-1522(+)
MQSKSRTRRWTTSSDPLCWPARCSAANPCSSRCWRRRQRRTAPPATAPLPRTRRLFPPLLPRSSRSFCSTSPIPGSPSSSPPPPIPIPPLPRSLPTPPPRPETDREREGCGWGRRVPTRGWTSARLDEPASAIPSLLRARRWRRRCTWLARLRTHIPHGLCWVAVCWVVVWTPLRWVPTTLLLHLLPLRQHQHHQQKLYAAKRHMAEHSGTPLPCRGSSTGVTGVGPKTTSSCPNWPLFPSPR